MTQSQENIGSSDKHVLIHLIRIFTWLSSKLYTSTDTSLSGIPDISHNMEEQS